MKLEVQMPVEVEADAIRIEAAVNYGDEDIPSDFPFRTGDMWNVTVDMASGKIRDWPEGVSGECHMKVVDSGSYYLLCGGKQLAAIENDYVPCCIPGSYGDYIEFSIGPDGAVKNWSQYATAHNVHKAFFGAEHGR